MAQNSKVVDLSHPWRPDLWPFVGLPQPKVSDVIRTPNNGPIVQQISTSMHVGTHIDAPLHFVRTASDIAGIPLDTLYHEGVVVDVSDKVKEWDILYPEHITDRVDVKEGDILIIHYGWHHYYFGEREANEERYFCMHPGPDAEMAKWMLKKKIRWFGVDAGSGDHPMNTGLVRQNKPELVKKFEQKVGKKVDEVFPKETASVMHYMLFPHGITHAENVGGELDKVLNERCTIGAFPWKWEGGDASICRIVAFL